MKDDKEKLRQDLEVEGLLSGFVDGELDEVQVQKVCAATDCAQRAQAEIERSELRRCIKAFVRAERATGDANWSCWSAIEVQLEPYRKSRRFLPNPVFSGHRFPKNHRLSKKSAHVGGEAGRSSNDKSQNRGASSSTLIQAQALLENLMRPQLAGAIFACSIGLMALSLWESQSALESGTDTLVADAKVGATGAEVVATTSVERGDSSLQLAKTDFPTSKAVRSSAGQTPSSAAESQASNVLASFVSTEGSPTRRAGERLSEQEATVSFAGFANLNGNAVAPSRRMPLYQSMNPKGLKVGTADIDWIEAQSHIEIVPASNKNRPPVIWVGDTIR